jgi:excisionase family DNA binding protein
MQDPIPDDLVVAPKNDDLEGLRALADAIDTADAVFVRSDDGDPLELPESAREGLERLVSYLAADMAVAMKPYDEILTTREAAEILGMSRQYLVHLLESDAIRIPVEKVGPGAGGHRRIKLRDVLAYREERTAEIDARIHRSPDDDRSGGADATARAARQSVASA